MEENQRKFDYRIKTLDPHIVALLASIDEARGVFKVGVKMTTQTITNLRKSVLITSAGASTRIEGSKLSDQEVKKIMQGMSIQKFADRDSQEVVGYLETLENVFASFKTLEIRESTIMSLHKELLKYSNKDDLHRGAYKKKENLVGVLGPDGTVIQVMFETTTAWQTPAEMTELLEWTYTALDKERFHPLLVISNFIIEFLKIHPFEDGNGRLSRVLTNLLLLRSGYQFVQYVSHEQIVERRKDEYYFALRSSQSTFKTKDESIKPWLNFFLSAIKEQVIKSLILVDQDHEDGMSTKQNNVLAFFDKVNEASPSEIANDTGIVISTVRKSLERLVYLGKVKRIGKGRSTRYVKL